jgi:hypothetical protein
VDGSREVTPTPIIALPPGFVSNPQGAFWGALFRRLSFLHILQSRAPTSGQDTKVSSFANACLLPLTRGLPQVRWSHVCKIHLPLCGSHVRKAKQSKAYFPYTNSGKGKEDKIMKTAYREFELVLGNGEKCQVRYCDSWGCALFGKRTIHFEFLHCLSISKTKYRSEFRTVGENEKVDPEEWAQLIIESLTGIQFNGENIQQKLL